MGRWMLREKGKKAPLEQTQSTTWQINQRTSSRLNDQPRFNFRGHGVWGGEETTMSGTPARM